MNDLEWFKLALWLGLLALGFIFRKPVLTVLSSLLGLYMGLGYYSDGPILALVFVAVNVYLGYDGLENWDLG